jgi:hypothetical protein
MIRKNAPLKWGLLSGHYIFHLGFFVKLKVPNCFSLPFPASKILAKMKLPAVRLCGQGIQAKANQGRPEYGTP